MWVKCIGESSWFRRICMSAYNYCIYGKYYVCMECKKYQVAQCYIIYVFHDAAMYKLFVVCGLSVGFGIMTIIICKLQ